MAREYARIKIEIWMDTDFRGLTESAQRLYFLLLTHSTLNACGVGDWREGRLAALASDSTQEGLRQSAWELGQARMIAVDPVTEEVLVRSFVRHDGILKSPNMTTALAKDFAGIASQKLMAITAQEVRRAFVDNPTWKGFDASESVRSKFVEGFDLGSELVPEWFQNGSELVPKSGALNQVGTNLEGFESGSEMVPLSLSPQPSTRRRSPQPYTETQTQTRFDAFWAAYPNKRDKRKAENAFVKALQRASVETIIQAATNYRDDPNRDDQFTKYPATWLNNDCWNDPPLPPRKSGNDRIARDRDFWASEMAQAQAVDNADHRKEIGS